MAENVFKKEYAAPSLCSPGKWGLPSLFSCFLFFLFAAPILAQDGRIIEKISVEGNTRVSDATVLAKLKTRVGERYLKRTVQEDIQNLYKEGYFFFITVDWKEGKEGIEVVFKVTENPYVQEILFRGLSKFDEKEIIAELNLKGTRFISDFTLEMKRRELLEFFQGKGYFFAQARYEVLPHEKGSTILFHSIEGPRVKVESIVFHGNNELAVSEILSVMLTEECGLFYSGLFRESVLMEDIQEIKRLYRIKGYRDVKAYLGWLDFNDEKTRVFVNIIIHEGELYVVDEIRAEGNEIFSDEELIVHLDFQPGDIYRLDKANAGLRSINSLYREHAFLDVSVKLREVFSDEGNRVTLVLDVEEGRKIRIGKISIKGNVWTKGDVIRRALEVYPGQEINVNKLHRSVERLKQTQFFEVDSVYVRYIPTEDPDVRDLLIEVEEGRTGNFNFSAGVGSNSGLMGLISYRKKNFDITDLPDYPWEIFAGGAFTGGGQHLVLELSPGIQVSRLRLGFEDPYLFGTENSGGIDLFRYLRIFRRYDLHRTGTAVKFGRKFGPDWYASTRFRNVRVEVDDVDERAPRDVWSVEGGNTLRSTEMTLTCDFRDSFLTPSQGYQLSLSGEYAGNFQGGDFSYSKLLQSGQWHTTLYRDKFDRKHIFHFHGRLGWGEANDGCPEIPIFEGFYAGGLNSMRGFDFRGAGPHDEGEPIGGDFLWLGSMEYDFPIYDRMLRGVVFCDFGKVDTDIHRGMFDDVRLAAGFGFRFFIPFLGPIPFEINFGFPFMKEKDDETELISFSIGHPFSF